MKSIKKIISAIVIMIMSMSLVACSSGNELTREERGEYYKLLGMDSNSNIQDSTEKENSSETSIKYNSKYEEAIKWYIEYLENDTEEFDSNYKKLSDLFSEEMILDIKNKYSISGKGYLLKDDNVTQEESSKSYDTAMVIHLQYAEPVNPYSYYEIMNGELKGKFAKIKEMIDEKSVIIFNSKPEYNELPDNVVEFTNKDIQYTKYNTDYSYLLTSEQSKTEKETQESTTEAETKNTKTVSYRTTYGNNITYTVRDGSKTYIYKLVIQNGKINSIVKYSVFK